MGKSSITSWVEDLSRQLVSFADPVRAPEQKRYLKSPYKFYGVRKPLIDQIARQFMRQNRNISPEEIIGLANTLWKSSYHEQKSLAIALLNNFSNKWDTRTIKLVDRMIDDVTGWDHLDELAIHVLGPLIHRGFAPVGYLEECSLAANFWKRRAALIAQITFLRRGQGDIKLHLDLCYKLMSEKEFFIRKAIGWSLRELAKAKPQTVFDFLVRYKGQVSGLTFREASRNLPDDLKSKLS